MKSCFSFLTLIIASLVFNGFCTAQANEITEQHTIYQLKESVLSQIENSEEYTDEEKIIIERCFEDLEISNTIECVFWSGTNKAQEIVKLIKNQIIAIKNRICSSKEKNELDDCEQLKQDIMGITKVLAGKFKKSIVNRKEYFSNQLKLKSIIRKICKANKDKSCKKNIHHKLTQKCTNPDTTLDALETLACKISHAQKLMEHAEMFNNGQATDI